MVQCNNKLKKKVKLANGSNMKFKSISRVKIKIYDNSITVFDEVKYILKLKRNLIFLSKLNCLSYEVFYSK